VMGVSGALAIAMAFGAQTWASIATSSNAPAALRPAASQIMTVLACALPLFVAAEMLNALLACYDRVLLQQGVRLIATAVNLAALIAFAQPLGVLAIVLGFVLGQAAMALLQAIVLFRLGLRVRRSATSARLDAAFYAVAGAFIAAAACSQVYAIYEKNAITLFGAGWVSAMQYAVTLVNVIITLFSTSVVNLMWPRLLAEAKSADASSLRQAVARGSELLLLGLVPVALFCYLAAPDMIGVLFARGAFGAESLEQTTRALRGTIFAAVPIALTALLVRALVTLGRGRPLTVIGIVIAASGSAMLMCAQLTADLRFLLVHWLIGNTAGAITAAGFFLRGQQVSGDDVRHAASWLARLAAAAAVSAIAWLCLAPSLAAYATLPRLIVGGLVFCGIFAASAAVLRLLPRKTHAAPRIQASA
jgi:putative peptidoglycan lipid II flippase